MLDKTKLMEMLKEIAEIAKASNNELTKEEIRDYFKGIDLEENHYIHIYTYLAESKITVTGFDYQPPATVAGEADELSKEDSIFLKMYLEDLKALPDLTEIEESVLLSELLKGNQDAKKRFMESMLKEVVEISYEYKNKGVPMEDLIQEGNIGLIKGMENISGLQDFKASKEFIIDVVKRQMEAGINAQQLEDDWENTVLAKTNLLREATEHLAKDLGRIANVHELSEFTKISEGEIKDIVKLSGNVIEIGKCR